MDPKAFLLQKFNARAQERVSRGCLISIMLDSSVVNPYVQDNLILIRIPKPVNRTLFFYFCGLIETIHTKLQAHLQGAP